VLAVIAWFLLSYTKFGVSCRAVGGNVTSARRAGLPVRRIIIAAYVISGFSSAVAGIILTSLLTTSTVTLGQ
jgi:ribose/xylose/arabinose/galactoside ABC-type transport system permease subunit